MNQLYRDELMEIYKNPKHKGDLPEADTETYEKNPICGDEIKLKVKLENGVIQKAMFEGSACAVSIISAEKLLDHIEGMKLKDALELTQEDLLEILNIDVSMSRLRCATLVLKALHKALLKVKESPKE